MFKKTRKFKNLDVTGTVRFAKISDLEFIFLNLGDQLAKHDLMLI